MMKSFRRRSSSFTKREVEAVTSANELTQTRPGATPQEKLFVRRRTSESIPSPVEDNRLKCKFEAIDVLLQILLHQDELTLKEYTINNSKIKVLVIEYTEF